MMFKRRLIPYTVPESGETSVNVDDPVPKFEKSFSDFVGTKYAVSFSSGRGALHYIYEFFGVKGKTALLPSYTCIPAIDSARWAGAVPHFLDVDPDFYNPVLDAESRKIKSLGAVSLSYLYGLVGNLQENVDFAKENGIPLVEDAAIALGGRYKSKDVGTIGDAAMFSMQDSKIITCWRGGMVTTDNKELRDFLESKKASQVAVPKSKSMFNVTFSKVRRSLSSPGVYGMTMFPLKMAMTSKSMRGTLGKIMGFNPLESVNGISPESMPAGDGMKMSDLQAAGALSQMKDVQKRIDRRRNMAKILQEGLEGAKNVHFPADTKDSKHAYGRFPVRIEGVDKNKVYERMLSMGVEVSMNYPYLCPSTPFMKKYGFDESDYPVASRATRETFLLPFHTRLEDSDLEHIVGCVKKLSEAV